MTGIYELQQQITSQHPVARAYAYSGEWVADCPRECGSVEFLFDHAVPGDLRSPRLTRKTIFYCTYCSQVADIEWAEHEDLIMAELRKRPIPHTRNWYPRNHPVAVKHNIAHGQTLEELAAESRENGVF